MPTPLRWVLLATVCALVSAPSVAQGVKKVASLTVTPDSLALNPGDLGIARCVPRTSQGDTLKNLCSWRSSDTTVAKALSGTQTTTIAARKAGAVTITASVGGKTASLRVRVVSVVVTPVVGRVLMRPKAVTLIAGGTQQFCAFIAFADGHVALRTNDQTTPGCLTEYAGFTLMERSVTLDEQAVADLVCINWVATGGTITPEICGTPS